MMKVIPPILVIDLGTTSLRCSVLDSAGEVLASRRSALPEQRDALGLSWDGNALAALVLSEAELLAREWRPQGVAIATQRTTALIWDAVSGKVLGPVLSWSDGRTRDLDRSLRAQGLVFLPGLSASKWRWLLDQSDPERTLTHKGNVRAGTMDSWLIWVLSEGAAHITDHVDASHSGLFDIAALEWDYALAEAMQIDASILPHPVSCNQTGATATALYGNPPILALIGDQQASLVGQGCDTKGAAKITFGTSAVANIILGTAPLAQHSRDAFGNVALSTQESTLYGAEAAVMSAGSSIEWLIRLGIIADAGVIDQLVDPATRSSVVFVAALDGIGVPHWQPHARGAFFGLSAANGPADMVRAVLDGIVAATADIIVRLEAAGGLPITRISLDGGLTNSRAFTAILAATLNRPLWYANTAEATTLGVARLAFRGLGHKMPLPAPRLLTAPEGTKPADCAAWRDAVDLVLVDQKQRKTRLVERKS